MSRYPALESLRGLAALVVVLHHHLLVLPSLYPYREDAAGISALLLYSPLHLFWAGGEAVLLFFLLSGFVLSLGTWEGRPLNMQAFIVKRLWRIWVPFMVAVTLAYACALLIGTPTIPGTSDWFAATWQLASPSAYLKHLVMLTTMDQVGGAFIPVVWSLKWEMWGSLLLPLVLLWARQSPLIVLSTCLLSLALYFGGENGSDGNSGLLRYLPMFVLGAFLARHRETVVSWVRRQPARFLLGLALLLIPVGWYGFESHPSGGRQLLNDVVVLGASALLIVLSLGWPQFQKWLTRPVLVWLGRISFSLYLYHALVLTVVVRLGGPFLPLPFLLFLSLALSFVVAHVAYEKVEKPAMRHGQAQTMITLASPI